MKDIRVPCDSKRRRTRRRLSATEEHGGRRRGVPLFPEGSPRINW